MEEDMDDGSLVIPLFKKKKGGSGASASSKKKKNLRASSAAAATTVEGEAQAASSQLDQGDAGDQIEDGNTVISRISKKFMLKTTSTKSKQQSRPSLGSVTVSLLSVSFISLF